MKKILLTFITLFLALTSFAQNASSQATLTINITEVRTIEILGDKKVGINIATATDFLNVATATGVSTSVPNHLKVTSSGGFKITAKAVDLTGSTQSIPANKVFLNVTGYTNSVGGVMAGYVAIPNFNLNNTAGTLISTSAIGGGTPQTIFDIDYTLKNVANIANLPAGTYTTQVIYTIETI